jgi:2-dehydropantoate 2-reductase
MGCLFAGALHRAGRGVTLLLREPPRAARLPLVIEEDEGPRELTVAASATGDAGRIERLLVTTKAYDVVDAVAAVGHRLDRESRVLLLANGMGFARELGERCPHLDLYLGTTTEGAYRIGPRHVRHAGRGTTRIGQPGRPSAPAWFGEWADSVSRSRWEPDIEGALWLKLAINCAVNPLTALHRCRNGELQRDPALAGEVDRLCGEIERVGRASGRGSAAAGLRDAVYRVIRDTAGNRSSMLQDVLAGRRTEIDYITGYLVRLAEQRGVDVPHNRELLRRVRALGC